MLYNPNFKGVEFDPLLAEAGSNNFVLSVKAWIERTGAIGIMAKAGRYGGTYAHRDIAYHFGMWISPRFQLLLVKEYQRLKADEQKQLAWSAKRELSKINYRIHTDAIKSHLIPAGTKQIIHHDATNVQQKHLRTRILYTIRNYTNRLNHQTDFSSSHKSANEWFGEYLLNNEYTLVRCLNHSSSPRASAPS